MHWHGDDDGEDLKRDIPNLILVRWIVAFVKPHIRAIIVVIPIMALSICFQLMLPMLLGFIIDTITNPERGSTEKLNYSILPFFLRDIIKYIAGSSSDPSGILKVVYATLGCYISIMLIGLVLSYTYLVLLARIGLRIIANLKKKLLRHVLELDLKFYATYTPGTLIARVESDTERLRQLFTEVTFNIISTIIMVFFIVYILINKDWRVALTIFTVVPVLMVITYFFLRFIRPYYKKVREKWAHILSFVTEYVQGVDIIQLYNYDKRAKERLHEKNIDKYIVERNSQFYEYGFWGFYWAAQIIAIMIALTLGTNKIALGTMTVGTLVMFLEYIRRVFQPLMQFSEQLNFIQRALVSAERVYKILHIRSAVLDPEFADHKPSLDREIIFENVSFAYETDNYVLQDVSFTIKAGEKVALVGASGGGKSTVVNLLCRFYDPNNGRILADGRDIKEFNQKDWRELIGLVLQDVYLFPGSIADNLRVMDPSIPLSRVEEASGIVHADEFIRKMRDGYKSELAERGANLSVGERQLLSFARALTFDPPLLILDEATSSVDPHTERLIQDGIDKLLHGRTSVVVAHRLSTILNADKIIVIEHGKVVEQGSHEELIKSDGLYKHLYELQFEKASASEGGDKS